MEKLQTKINTKSWINDPNEAYVRATGEKAIRDVVPVAWGARGITDKPINLDVKSLSSESARKHWKKKADIAADEAAIDAGFLKKPIRSEDYSLEFDNGKLDHISDESDETRISYSSLADISFGIAFGKAPDGQAIAEHDYNGDAIDKFHGRNKEVEPK